MTSADTYLKKSEVSLSHYLAFSKFTDDDLRIVCRIATENREKYPNINTVLDRANEIRIKGRASE